jgi:hypothetical protein
MGGNATPPPVNCGARIVPARRAARSLLPPRLCAAAGDEATGLRGMRAGAARVQLGAHGLVDEMRLDLDGEDGGLEREVLRLLAVESSTGALGAATALVLSHFDDAVLGPGWRP